MDISVFRVLNTDVELFAAAISQVRLHCSERDRNRSKGSYCLWGSDPEVYIDLELTKNINNFSIKAR